MAIDVLVPQMGESVLEGTILEWKVKVGDEVKYDQPLVELMTDKVNVEIPSEADGTITQILAKEGDVVPVGTRIAVIDDGKAAGKKAASDQKPAAGPQPAEPAAPVAAAAPKAPAKQGTAPAGKGKMSPKVKMLIREYALDPATIVPTGKDGLVTVQDVEDAVAARSADAGFTRQTIPSPAPTTAPGTSGAPGAASVAPQAPTPAEPKVKVQVPVFEPLPESQRERREPVVGIRKMISDHMVRSVQTSPHVTTFEDVDMTALVDYRESIKKEFRETYGANITYMPFIMKAVCIALKEYPKLNASMTEKEIIYKNYFNIGIAVAREEGLIVPVIRNADRKSIVEIAVEIAQIGERARKNQLSPDDVSGGTFSLTNAGMFGAMASTPIINQPQVAILGIHAIVKRPWVVDDEIKIRHISSFGLSFDHRLIDGHTAVQFLHRVVGFLENPAGMVLHLR
jgi:pyruvate/2-oxoglutarate dehydrogenase complex dihydrolipoamide acyltransferase (E2) component